MHIAAASIGDGTYLNHCGDDGCLCICLSMVLWPPRQQWSRLW